MNLMRLTSTVVTASSILGCGNTAVGPGDAVGWRSLAPPEEKAIGKYIEKLPHNRVTLGGQGFVITDDLIRSSPSYNDVSDEEYSNYKAGAELSIKQITAKAGIEYSASKVSNSNGWSITQIDNFSRGAPLEKEFIYKCIMVSEYTFDAKSKVNGNVDLDAGKLAATFGVDVAKISLSSSPASPDSLKISIKNPNLCLSYISAKLERPWFNDGGEIRTITKKTDDGKYENKFKLSLNEFSEPRSPDLGSHAIDSKPFYRLFLSGPAEAPTLSFWKEDREFPDRPPTYFALKEKAPGQWFGQYGIEHYYYGDMKYALVRLELDAKRLPDGSIQVKSANLYSPTYKLSLK
ncbi:hypothetical protein [Pseudomonas farris]